MTKGQKTNENGYKTEWTSQKNQANDQWITEIRFKLNSQYGKQHLTKIIY